MSLITRCPACGTMFKVVPDQLRISEGWVRCGHCARSSTPPRICTIADAADRAPRLQPRAGIDVDGDSRAAVDTDAAGAGAPGRHAGRGLRQSTDAGGRVGPSVDAMARAIRSNHRPPGSLSTFAAPPRRRPVVSWRAGDRLEPAPDPRRRRSPAPPTPIAAPTSAAPPACIELRDEPVVASPHAEPPRRQRRAPDRPNAAEPSDAGRGAAESATPTGVEPAADAMPRRSTRRRRTRKRVVPVAQPRRGAWRCCSLCWSCCWSRCWLQVLHAASATRIAARSPRCARCCARCADCCGCDARGRCARSSDIVIDSSSFTRACGGDALPAELRAAQPGATSPLAMPAIELTLTRHAGPAGGAPRAAAGRVRRRRRDRCRRARTCEHRAARAGRRRGRRQRCRASPATACWPSIPDASSSSLPDQRPPWQQSSAAPSRSTPS